MSHDSTARAIGPSIGVVAIVVITVLLASMVVVGLPQFGLERAGSQFDSAVDGGAAGSGASYDHTDDLIWPETHSGGTTTTHHVNYHIDSDSDTAGNSLNNVVVEYTGSDVSGVSDDDVVRVGVDTNGDGTIDDSAMSDMYGDDGVSISDGGTTMRVEFTGNVDLYAGDDIILVYEDATNPGPGDHDVTVGVNGDVEKSGSLEIE